MIIALHSSDKTNFPNLPLMKLSTYHKKQNDTVVWYNPKNKDSYDKIYSSKVFSYTPEDTTLPEKTIKGGTGYNFDVNLPDEIEHIMPDYSLYPEFKASLGFTTRGCIRNCPWCIVPKKEGKIKEQANINEFLRSDSKELILMDNNILAHPFGLSQLERAISKNLKVDCNQGLDARLIAENQDIAKLLAKIKWIKIRLACDKQSQMESVEKAVNSIRKYSGKKGNFFCYVLTKEIPDALERVMFLKKLGVDPFAQPYREPGSVDEPEKILRQFARWVNHKAIFKTVTWEDYFIAQQNKKLRK